MTRTSRLDDIMEFADNIDAYEQKQKAKEQIKLLFLEVLENTNGYNAAQLRENLREAVEAL